MTTPSSEQVRQALERIRCATCAHETREQALLDQRWTLAGTIKLVSYVGAAIVSGYAWYGILCTGKWLLRAMGVNLQ